MFSQSLSNPLLFPLICTNKNYEVATSGIVGMEQVCYDTYEAEASSKDK